MKKRILLGVTLLTFVFAFSGVMAQAATPYVEGTLWFPDVKSGASFSWTITTVDADGATTWDWAWANNVTLTQGEKITMEWSEDTDNTTQLGLTGPVPYDGVTTKVGTFTCNFTEDETFFNYFVIPVYNNGTVNQTESTFNALERFWHWNYNLPSSELPVGEYTWNLAMDKTTPSDVGAMAAKGDEVVGYITTHDFFDTLDPETFVFDLHYDAVSGILKKMVYPTTKTGELTANNTQPMTLGLDALVIEFDGEDASPTAWSFYEATAAPGFEAPIVVTGLFAFAAIVVIRRRN